MCWRVFCDVFDSIFGTVLIALFESMEATLAMHTPSGFALSVGMRGRVVSMTLLT